MSFIKEPLVVVTIGLVLFGVFLISILIAHTPSIPNMVCKRYEPQTSMVGINMGGMVVMQPITTQQCVAWEVRG